MKVKHLVIAFLLLLCIISPFTIGEKPSVLGMASIISLIVSTAGLVVYVIAHWDDPIKRSKE